MKIQKKGTARKERRARIKRAQKFCAQLTRKATAAERALRVAFERQGWRHQFQSVQIKHGTDARFYIADFRLWLVSGERLIVEVDGSAHRGREAYDANRTAWLERHKKARVVRFTNKEVLTEMDQVLMQLALFDPLPHASHRTVDQERSIQQRRERPLIPRTCAGCHEVPTDTKVVVYKNGTEHRRWWCAACQRLVGGNPIPRGTTPEDIERLIDLAG